MNRSHIPHAVTHQTRIACCAIALMAFVSVSFAHRNATSPIAPRRWENPIRRLDFYNPADLNVGAPNTVRLIYFLPNDRPYRADVEQQMKTEIRTVQTFYADQMEAHGFGNPPFRIETDPKGEPMVHRVDGQHPFSHYDNTDGIAVIDELAETFDFTANIYFVVLGADAIRTVSGEPVGGIGHRQTKTGGWLLVANEISWDLVAHELGHAFGLNHDFRGGAYIMSYNPDPNQLSPCAAFFLSVHPYFNPDTPADHDEQRLPTIELLSPRRYAPGSNNVPVRVEVSDSDGLHQVLLHTVGGLQECRRLTGDTKAVIEFDYDGGFGLEGFTALSYSRTGELFIESVDTLGNVDALFFTLAESSPYHIADLLGHGEAVLSVAFSPEGILAVGADDGSVTLWNVATRQQITTLQKAEHWVENVAFSPSGHLLAVGTREQVTLWSVATQQQVAHFRHPSEFTSVAFSPDGQTIAAGMTDGTITLWDVATHRNIATLTHGNYVSDVAFSGQGIMASASDSGTVHLWDIETQQKRTTITHEDLVLFVAFSPDGGTLAYGGWGRIPIQLFDVATQQPIARITYNSVVTDVAFSRDGKSLASCGWDSTVQLWDVTTQVPFATFPSAEPLKTVAFSHDGSLLATGGTETGVVELWDTSAVLPHRVEALTTVDIPDKNLRAAIADALGVNASEPITKGAMQTLTELNAPNANISDLTGLQFATRLRLLFLGYEYGFPNPINSNAVDDLTPIAELTHLTFLELSGNALTDISELSALTNLTYLGLDDNSISDISALSSLTKLTGLWLLDNPLNTMAFTTHIPFHQSRGTEVHFDPPKADVNRDGVVNIFDLVRVANAFGTDAETHSAMDVNTDGEINILDLVLVASFFE